MKLFTLSFVLSLMVSAVLVQEIIQDGPGIIRSSSDAPKTAEAATTPSPGEITTQETASTPGIPAYTDQPTNATNSGDLIANESVSESTIEKGPAKQEAANKSILPMIVRTDNGYIYWVPTGFSSSVGPFNSVVMLFAFLLIRVWLS